MLAELNNLKFLKLARLVAFVVFSNYLSFEIVFQKTYLILNIKNMPLAFSYSHTYSFYSKNEGIYI